MEDPGFSIREARACDANVIIRAHRESIRALCAKDYSSEEIEAWATHDYAPERWVQTIAEERVWVVTDAAETVLGFAHLRFESDAAAEVEGLYLVASASGRGLGRRLLELMLGECRQRGVSDVRLMSTRTSVSFYEHFAFKRTEKKVLVPRGGRIIECLEMRLA